MKMAKAVACTAAAAADLQVEQQQLLLSQAGSDLVCYLQPQLTATYGCVWLLLRVLCCSVCTAYASTRCSRCIHLQFLSLIVAIVRFKAICAQQHSGLMISRCCCDAGGDVEDGARRPLHAIVAVLNYCTVQLG
jgi:hypothetical protein